MPIFARLKPQSPRQGYPLLTLTYSGIRFEAGGHAYEITAKQAEFLRTYHEIETDPATPLAFDVWTGTAAGPADPAPQVPAPVPVPLPPRRSTPGPITTADITPPKSEPASTAHVPIPPPPPPVEAAPEPEIEEPPEDPAVIAAREAAEAKNRALLASRFPTKTKTNRYRKP